MKRFVGVLFFVIVLTGCSTTINCPICGFDFDPDDAQALAQEREARKANLKE